MLETVFGLTKTKIKLQLYLKITKLTHSHLLYISSCTQSTCILNKKVIIVTNREGKQAALLVLSYSVCFSLVWLFVHQNTVRVSDYIASSESKQDESNPVL